LVRNGGGGLGKKERGDEEKKERGDEEKKERGDEESVYSIFFHEK
jgi:hypothetical protein